MDNNNNNNESSNSYLKGVNKSSVKITKPTRKPFIPDPTPNPVLPTQQQPPVYNVSKNDFREVVQKLTGSPAHQNNPFPPTNTSTNINPNNNNNINPKSSSRLQRIRPPPLIQINKQNDNSGGSGSYLLPPLPSVHHASESPISAYMRVLGKTAMGPTGDVAAEKESPISSYMRFLQSSVYARELRPPTVPQQTQQQQVINNSNNNSNDVLQIQQQQQGNGNLETFPVMPVSPLAFGGCVPSPRGQYGMLGSPGSLLFSPTSGMPVSPTWKV